MGFYYYGHLKAGSPLYQERHLIDKTWIRDEQIVDTEHLYNLFRNDISCYVIVYGGRQSGKTSLINHMKMQIERRCLGSACWIDFQNCIGYSAEDALIYIAQQIVGQAQELQEAKPPDTFSLGGLEFECWLKNLPYEKPLVILMEELGWLPHETRQKLAGIFRAMHEHSQGSRLEKVICFFFGGIELHEMAAVDVSPLYNVCEKYMLIDLNQKATAHLLNAGFGENTGLDFPKLAGLIDQFVSGQPYLTQKFGKMLYSQNLERNPNALEDIVQAVAMRLMDDDYLDHSCETIIEYQLANACKALFSHPDYSSWRKDWNKLLLLSAAKVKNGQIQVSNRLLEQVLQERLQQVTDESQPQHKVGPQISNVTINTQGGAVIQGNLNTQGGNFVGRNLAQFSAHTMSSIEKETVLSYLRRRKEVIEQLAVLPCMKDHLDRHIFFSRVTLSGYGTAINMFGEPGEAVERIFSSLEQMERKPGGRYPLGLFLSEVAIEAGSEEGRKIQAFIEQYGL